MNQNTNIRFDEMNQNLNKKFEAIEKSFDFIDTRFSEMQNLILTLYGTVMALIIALIGYMIWDRKTAQQPLKIRVGKVETDIVLIEDQLEIRNPSGPVVIRLISALRKLAETDERVAAILRSYSLL
ncbi:MAG: hypothetical protein HQK67_11650 [Desulfamplus sp.]|nr:hypothetical protein [Desulfamplus sp.]